MNNPENLMLILNLPVAYSSELIKNFHFTGCLVKIKFVGIKKIIEMHCIQNHFYYVFLIF